MQKLLILVMKDTCIDKWWAFDTWWNKGAQSSTNTCHHLLDKNNLVLSTQEHGSTYCSDTVISFINYRGLLAMWSWLESTSNSCCVPRFTIIYSIQDWHLIPDKWWAGFSQLHWCTSSYSRWLGRIQRKLKRFCHVCLVMQTHWKMCERCDPNFRYVNKHIRNTGQVIAEMFKLFSSNTLHMSYLFLQYIPSINWLQFNQPQTQYGHSFYMYLYSWNVTLHWFCP